MEWGKQDVLESADLRLLLILKLILKLIFKLILKAGF
jgi:hypothetical protein